METTCIKPETSALVTGSRSLLQNILLNPLTLIIGAVAILIYWIGDPGSALVFDQTQSALANGWKVITCHLVHWNADHLFWDLVVFCGIGVMLERKSWPIFAGTLLVSAIIIPPLAVWMHADVTSYRGLSGIDTALFSAFAFLGLFENLRRRSWTEVLVYSTLLLAMIGKCACEWIFGNTFFVASELFIPLPIAHGLGILVGLAMVVLIKTGRNSGV